MATELDSLKAMLDRPIRVSTHEGRAFRGRLVCVDRLFNLVLQDAEEEPSNRAVGLVMIPGGSVAAASVRADLDNDDLYS